MADSVSNFSYDSQCVAGRGLLGTAYCLTPRLCRDALGILRGGKFRERHVAGVTMCVVSRLGGRKDVLRKIDDVAFVSWGYLFYSLWDRYGRVYITRAMARRLGIDQLDDEQLTSLVSSPAAASTRDTVLRQLWIYWKTKTELLLGRELTAMERCLKTLFDTRGIPFEEGLAHLLVLFEQISVAPEEIFAVAWRHYYDYPYAEADDLSHLTSEEIERLFSLRKKKLQGARLFDRHKEKQQRIRQWLEIYRQGEFHRLDRLAANPAEEAEMFYSFVALLDVPVMDCLASAFYDDAMEEQITLEEAERGRSIAHDLNLEEPLDLFRRRLRPNESDKGKVVVMGADMDWYRSAKVRTFVQSLLTQGLIRRVLAADSLEDRVLLYPEFSRGSMLFVQPWKMGSDRIQFTDFETVLRSARPCLSQGENVLMMVPTETCTKIGVHCGESRGLFPNFLSCVYAGDERMIVSAVLMDRTFGKNGYFIRSRRNALMHGIVQPGLHGVPLDRNERLAREPAFPGNHFMPEVRFGELWDAVIFLGPRQNEGNDERGLPPSPPRGRRGFSQSECRLPSTLDSSLLVSGRQGF